MHIKEVRCVEFDTSTEKETIVRGFNPTLNIISGSNSNFVESLSFVLGITESNIAREVCVKFEKDDQKITLFKKIHSDKSIVYKISECTTNLTKVEELLRLNKLDHYKKNFMISESSINNRENLLKIEEFAGLRIYKTQRKAVSENLGVKKEKLANFIALQSKMDKLSLDKKRINDELIKLRDQKTTNCEDINKYEHTLASKETCVSELKKEKTDSKEWWETLSEDTYDSSIKLAQEYDIQFESNEVVKTLVDNYRSVKDATNEEEHLQTRIQQLEDFEENAKKKLEDLTAERKILDDGFKVLRVKIEKKDPQLGNDDQGFQAIIYNSMNDNLEKRIVSAKAEHDSFREQLKLKLAELEDWQYENSDLLDQTSSLPNLEEEVKSNKSTMMMVYEENVNREIANLCNLSADLIPSLNGYQSCKGRIRALKREIAETRDLLSDSKILGKTLIDQEKNLEQELESISKEMENLVSLSLWKTWEAYKKAKTELEEEISVLESEISKLDRLDRETKKELQLFLVGVQRAFVVISSTMVPNVKASLQHRKEGDDALVHGFELFLEGKFALEDAPKIMRLLKLSFFLAVLHFKKAPIFVLNEVDAYYNEQDTRLIHDTLKAHFANSQVIIVSSNPYMFDTVGVNG